MEDGRNAGRQQETRASSTWGEGARGNLLKLDHLLALLLAHEDYLFDHKQLRCVEVHSQEHLQPTPPHARDTHKQTHAHTYIFVSRNRCAPLHFSSAKTLRGGDGLLMKDTREGAEL